jgi:hypothetical protein
MPSPLATTTLPDLVRATAFWSFPGSGSKPVVAVGRNDGYLALLDSGLKEAWASGAKTVGGFVPNLVSVGLNPITAAVLAPPGKTQSVVVSDSRGALLRVDSQDGTFAAPPQAAWAADRKNTPSIVLGGTQPIIACFSDVEPLGADPAFEVTTLRADGTTVWSVPFPWTPPVDMAYGDANGDGVLDLFAQGYDDQGQVHTRALSGTDGSTLWEFGGVSVPGGIQLSSSSDWLGNGRADYLTVLGNVFALAGPNGATLSSSSTNYMYFLPIPFDVDGDGVEELILQGGFVPTTVLHHDLVTPLWTSADDDHPLPYGAIAQCPGAPPSLVEGSRKNQARLKITVLSGPTGGTFTTLVLAGGKLFATESDAQTAGAALGQLGTVALEANLTGNGHPTAVIGSTDGWLYGVDPCSNTLDFALEIGSAVGEAILADTDGDGRDEILVTAADGFLYDIKHKAIDPPSFVWDIDPAHGIVDMQVHDEVTKDTLSGKWGAVSGATGYEVAIVDDKGNYVTNPHWQSAGTVVMTSLSGLSLVDGAKYHFAVRALSNDGPSPDIVSEGVIVHFPTGGAEPPDAGEDGGPTGEKFPLYGRACTCELLGDSPAGPLAAVSLGFLAALHRSRRKRRPRNV